MRYETLSLQRRVRGPRYCRYYITDVHSQTQSHITNRRSLLIPLRSTDHSSAKQILDSEGSNEIAQGSHFGTARFLGKHCSSEQT
jgi:hypothetical protein